MTDDQKILRAVEMILFASPLENAVVEKLVADAANPALWRFTRFEAIHHTGVTVWTANKDYGMEIKPDENSRIKTIPTYWNRKCLWRALRQAVRRADKGRADKALNAIAEKLGVEMGL